MSGACCASRSRPPQIPCLFVFSSKILNKYRDINVPFVRPARERCDKLLLFCKRKQMLFRQIRTLVLVAALSAKVSHAGTFRDDRGVTHAISGKPTIVTYARTAVTLSHFGKHFDFDCVLIDEIKCTDAFLRSFGCFAFHPQVSARTNLLASTASTPMTDQTTTLPTLKQVPPIQRILRQKKWSSLHQ